MKLPNCSKTAHAATSRVHDVHANLSQVVNGRPVANGLRNGWRARLKLERWRRGLEVFQVDVACTREEAAPKCTVGSSFASMGLPLPADCPCDMSVQIGIGSSHQRLVMGLVDCM